uniref:Uncharacterized protein n=1 Tax=Rhizophora mucronata TaxID=61149 RepID=A0A2P2IMT4_RHIMU
MKPNVEEAEVASIGTDSRSNGHSSLSDCEILDNALFRGLPRRFVPF